MQRVRGRDKIRESSFIKGSGMSERDKKKKKKKTNKNVPENFDVHKARLAMEKEMAIIKKLAEEREFESEDELEKYLKNLMSSGGLPEWAPSGPLEEAQEIIYQAWDMQSKRDRVNAAHRALEISADCADAYVLLAEETGQNVERALELYQSGVEAGERALGASTFIEDVGGFWGILETRPYMRARVGLAQCLWDVGRRWEAVGHYRDMLRLNPGDNQGIRYALAASLLELGEIDALQELLGQYDEPTADWLYTEALVTFLKQGDSPESRKRLLKALEHNRHVVPYLIGEKRLPKQLPEHVGFGDKNEAIVYVAMSGIGWLDAKGAIGWLISVCRNEQTMRQAQTENQDVPEAFVQAFESKGKTPQTPEEKRVTIYTFKVSLKESPRVWRKIEIKGTQTLHHLHQAIFKAYERYDEHLYAFFLSNRKWDSSSEYGLPDPESDAKNSRKATIDSLGLQAKKSFLYLFDFGDDWWHSVQLLGIKEVVSKGRYPRVVESQGEAPPQYPEEEV